MGSSTVLNEVVILFLIMIVGFVGRKSGVLEGDIAKKLSLLLLNIALPFITISSFNFSFSPEMLHNAGIMLAFALAAHLFFLYAGKLLYFMYPQKTNVVLRFTTIFSNCGYMGFPVLGGIYGKEGIFYGSIYVAVYHIFLWTGGVMIFTGKKDMRTIKKALLNPGIISIAIGLCIFLFSVKLPAPVSKAIDTVGSMTTPLSMMIIGIQLADADLKKLFRGFPVYYGTFVRLLGIPLFTMAVLKLAGLPEMLLGISILLVAMPSGTNTAIFAEIYDGDVELASKSVVISTILSIITIPLIIMVFNAFN